MVVLVVGGVIAALGAGAVLGRRYVTARAEQALADGVATAERRVQEALGGTATIRFEEDALPVLLALRAERVPAGSLVVEGARLPNGLAVRRLELRAPGDVDVADLVAHISPRAVSRQLGVPGLSVATSRGRLRLVVGLASIGVDVRVQEGRVVLSIPVAPPPIGTLLSAGLTELVPRPPAEIELHEVSVVADELEVRAIVDLRELLDDLDVG